MTDLSAEIWTPHLKPDEKILWQGRPYPQLCMRRGDVANIASGILIMVVSAGIGAMGLAMALSMRFDGLMLAAGLLPGLIIPGLFITGLYLAVFQFFRAAAKRRRTYYAITDQQLLVLETGKKTTLEAEPVSIDTYLDYVPGERASIYFKKIAKRRVHMSNTDNGRRQKIRYSTEYSYKGFELISDGAAAYMTILGAMGLKLSDPGAAAQNQGEIWESFLLEGETLLWTGAPATGLRPTPAGIAGSIFGAVVLYFMVPFFIEILPKTMKDSGFMVLTAVSTLPILLALWLGVGIWLMDIKKRKATRYALTNKRAFVASSFGKRKMVTHALKAFFRPLLRKDRVDSVTFGEEDWFNREGNADKRDLSFDHLADGKEVYDLLTEISIEMDANPNL